LRSTEEKEEDLKRKVQEVVVPPQRELVEGNEAIAEAAIKANCRFFFGYPITPQTEILEYMAKRLPQVGGFFLQAESEIAAISMVQGVACTGARVMTATSMSRGPALVWVVFHPLSLITSRPPREDMGISMSLF